MRGAKKGDVIQLTTKSKEVVECDSCARLMVNLDADEIKPGDLAKLKSLGVRISNPNTTKEICISCKVKTFSDHVNEWFDDNDDSDDDSSFFDGAGLFLGGLGGLGGGGGFGGFGGGGFGGGGAGRSF